MGFKKGSLLLFLFAPVAIWAFFFVRNNYLYPYQAARKLSSSQYVEEIKTKRGYYENQENKVVWQSKKLNITPPKISTKMSDAKVLAADADTWVDINLSTQKKILPPIRLAITVAPKPAPRFLTTSHSIGVLNCHLTR